MQCLAARAACDALASRQPGVSEQDLVSSLSFAPSTKKTKEKKPLPLVLTGSMCVLQTGIASIWKLIGLQKRRKIHMHVLKI